MVSSLVRGILTVIRTFFFYVFCVFWTGLVAYVVSVPLATFAWLLRIEGHQLANTNIHRFVTLCGVPWRAIADVTMDCQERVSEGQAVVICNHHSYIDIFLIFHVFPRIRMTARKSLFHIPFLGWAMSLLGHIPHERNNPEEALDRASLWLDRKTFVGVFPEGTRAPDGEIGTFHRGAFRLAQRSTELIQPVVVVGSGRVWGKGRFWIRRLGPVHMKILPPVEVPRSAGRKELVSIVETVRKMMLDEHRRIEIELFGEPTSPS